jgi:drug/metabolite transporter (DMT)-like permease
LNSLGPIAALFSSGTWAYGSANYSKLTRTFRPFDVNFTRALFAFPLFIVAAFVSAGGFTEGIEAYQMLSWTSAGWLFISIFASYAIGDVFFLWSTIALGVPGALAIASGYPIFSALIGLFFEGQSMSTIQWIGLATTIAGIIIVILNDPKGVPQSGEEVRSHPYLKKKWVGVSLAGLTAIGWSMNSYSIMKGGLGLNSAVANTFRMGMALPIIATLSFLTTRKGITPLPRAVVKKYLSVFIAETFFGSYFYMYGMTHSPLVLGSTLAALAPVLSVPVSIALKLEQFSWVRTFAVLTVVVGLSLLFR